MLRLLDRSAAEMIQMFSFTTPGVWAFQMLVGALVICVAFQIARELLNWANQQCEVWDWAENQRQQGRVPERMKIPVQIQGKVELWSWAEWVQATTRPCLRRNPLFTALGRSTAIALFAACGLVGILWTHSVLQFLISP
jgi:hypothetical protein